MDANNLVKYWLNGIRGVANALKMILRDGYPAGPSNVELLEEYVKELTEILRQMKEREGM